MSGPGKFEGTGMATPVRQMVLNYLCLLFCNSQHLSECLPLNLEKMLLLGSY